MRRFSIALTFLVLALISCSRYETAKNDPMNARVYTLGNGMKVYMTVNKDEPRVQANIAVRVGGKNDPADNTGLSHYLEHMLFKGTQKLGTQDYAAEAPLLSQIDSLFEIYRTLTDPVQREEMYAQIDKISYEASKLAIPNEYDKLMSLIGSRNSNAFTSEDVTCYTEDIPSNQIENWARIQADRFKNCVFRGFHTELEAVYEEKNTSMTDDTDKAMAALDQLLFPSHPYGSQTVIGTQDHLKNPSLKAIRKHKDTYYVPNNMAICLSGDFDPDATFEILNKYFGDWTKSNTLPERKAPERDTEIQKHSTDVMGAEANFVLMGWRAPGTSDEDAEYGRLAASILMNEQAGLLDLDVLKKHKILDGFAMNYDRVDWNILLLQGSPNDGQTLEEVEAILKEQVNRLITGDFSQELMDAACANYRLYKMQSMEDNDTRANMFVESFTDAIPLQQTINKGRKTENLSKEELVTWAREHLIPENYAVVYKREGEDPDIKRIKAPKITPISTNRDKQSDFFKEIASAPVVPIEPLFLDFKKDITVDNYNGLEVLYKHNEKNDIANITFWFDKGIQSSPKLDLAMEYLRYLGTSNKTSDEISLKLYSLASEWHFSVTDNFTCIYLNGLGIHTKEAIEELTNQVLNPVPDEEILQRVKDNLIARREDEMSRPGACNQALQRYTMYGKEYIEATVLSNEEVMAVTSEELLDAIKDMISYEHKILYHGPATLEEVKQMIAVFPSENLKPIVRDYPRKRITKTPIVYVAPYPAQQFNFMQYSNRGETLIIEQAPYIDLFNEYYGSGMNSIVFQEMRESRALAYGAGARLVRPSFSNDDYYFRAYIGSQNDKLQKAIEGFSEIIEKLPESAENLEIAKTAIINRIRTIRTNGIAAIYSYMRSRDFGLEVPMEKIVYDKVGQLTMFDLLSTHEKWIRGRTYYYTIVGEPKDLDMNYLRTLGPVYILDKKEMFGY